MASFRLDSPPFGGAGGLAVSSGQGRAPDSVEPSQGAMPGRRLRRPEEASEPSIPLRDVARPAGRWLARPGESRGESVEVLVWPGVVVPDSEKREVRVDLVPDAGLFEPWQDAVLEGGEELLDPAVLPGREGDGGAVANAEERQRPAEEPGGEDGLVVGAEDARSAVALDGVEQGAKERDGGAGAQLAEGEAGAGVVVEQAEDGARSARVGEEGEVEHPEEVARDAAGPAVLGVAPEAEDLFFLAAEHVGGEGLGPPTVSPRRRWRWLKAWAILRQP